MASLLIKRFEDLNGFVAIKMHREKCRNGIGIAFTICPVRSGYFLVVG